MGCAEVRQVAPEVALGLLTGEERAAVLAHLEGCEPCRVEVASLAGTADEVLLAAPEVAPPPGFAEGVLARLPAGAGTDDPATRVDPVAAAAPPRHRRRRRPRRRALVAAAAVVAAALAVGGLLATRGDGPDPVVATAEMRTGSGQRVGEASVTGDPATVVVDVPGWSGMVASWGDPGVDTYWVSVEVEDGSRSMAPVHPGRDSWRVAVDAPADAVVTVSVLDQQGRVWCSGRFGA